jgi:hypothetical protein
VSAATTTFALALPALPFVPSAPDAASRVDAAVQVELQPPLPPDDTPLPPNLLSIGQRALSASAGQLQQHLKHNRESAAVLAGLAAWLPPELVAQAAAEAAAAAVEAGRDGAGDAAAAAAEQAGGGGAAATPAAASSGADAWREEARLAASVVGLVAQLEEAWGDLLSKLELSQVCVFGRVEWRPVWSRLVLCASCIPHGAVITAAPPAPVCTQANNEQLQQALEEQQEQLAELQLVVQQQQQQHQAATPAEQQAQQHQHEHQQGSSAPHPLPVLLPVASHAPGASDAAPPLAVGSSGSVAGVVAGGSGQVASESSAPPPPLPAAAEVQAEEGPAAAAGPDGGGRLTPHLESPGRHAKTPGSAHSYVGSSGAVNGGNRWADEAMAKTSSSTSSVKAKSSWWGFGGGSGKAQRSALV